MVKGDLSRLWDIALAVTVCTVALLLLLPLILYSIEDSDIDVDERKEKLTNLLSDAAIVPNGSQCSPQFYNGSLCLQELQNWQKCLPEMRNDNIFIPSVIDQDLREELAHVLFTDIQLLSASKECQREFKSFWCLQLFGVCDGSGQKILPTYDQCIHLHYNTCHHLIDKAIVYTSLLFECSKCEGNFTICENMNTKPSSTTNVTCSDQFFFDENSSMCKPECGIWGPFPPDKLLALRVVFVVFDAIGIVGCIAVLILTWIKRKKLFAFPTVLVIYQMIALLSSIVVVDIGFILGGTVLCNSQDLIQNISPGQATMYCQFSGAFYLYIKFAMVLLWLSQSATFFWGVMWPMHYRVTKASGRIKYVHITVVAISFTLPIISIVSIQFSGGFGLFIPFPLFCSVNKPEAIFHRCIIPISLSVIIGTTLLVITGWKIADFKSNCCSTQSSERFRKRTSQNKLLLLISYSYITAVYNVSIMLAILKKKDKYIQVFSEHFMCQSVGEDMECVRDNFHQFESDLYAFSVSFILFSSFSCMYFIFLFDYGSCFKKTKIQRSKTSIALDVM